MKRKMGVVWHLRERMAAAGMWKTTDLVGPLAERGVRLSREQVYRLVAGQPERLNVYVLAALCDILGCTPNDLIEPVVENRTAGKRAVVGRRQPRSPDGDGGLGLGPVRPVRARITPEAVTGNGPEAP